MGNFTAQKVYQDITNRQSAQKPVKSNGGSGGAKKPMTLAEHDKLVHGGHYDGGRCKFRQQLAAKGMLPPNSGAGNGGASVGGGQMSLGDKVRQIGANARNAIRGGMEKVEGAATEVGGAVKSAVANVHEKAEQLSKKLAEAEGQTEKSSSNLEKMGQILGGIKSPEIKEEAADICQKVVNAINGGAQGGSEQPSSGQSQGQPEFNPKTHEDVDKWEDGEIEKLRGSNIPIEEFNKRLSNLRSKADEHHSRISEEEYWQDDLADLDPVDQDELDKWADEKSNELFNSFKSGKIDNETYRRRLGEVNSHFSKHTQRLSEISDDDNEDDNITGSEENSEIKSDTASPRRKNLRDALREHLASKFDNNTATEKDDEDAEYMDAHSANESMFKRGRISEEEFNKHRKEINDDYMKKQFARKFGVNYKPYSPQNKTNNGGGSSNKNGSVDELTKNRQHLQEMLSIFHTAFGRNSVVGKLASGVVANKVSDIDAEIAKMGHLSKNTHTQSKQSQGGSGSTGPVDTPKQSGGLRSIHGEINHGGNAEVQSLIDQMEDEYRNAKKSSEKIRIMSSYKKLKDMYEPKQT